jgi:hypothetical protein
MTAIVTQAAPPPYVLIATVRVDIVYLLSWGVGQGNSPRDGHPVFFKP